MRLATGDGSTYHSRFVMFGSAGRNDCSTKDFGLASLIGILPSHWLAIPLGRTPGRAVSAARARLK